MEWGTAADGSGTNYPIGVGTFNISADTALYALWMPNVDTISTTLAVTLSGDDATATGATKYILASTNTVPTPVLGMKMDNLAITALGTAEDGGTGMNVATNFGKYVFAFVTDSSGYITAMGVSDAISVVEAVKFANLGAKMGISAAPVKGAELTSVTAPSIAVGSLNNFTSAGTWATGFTGSNFNTTGTATYVITLTPEPGYTFVGSNILNAGIFETNAGFYADADGEPVAALSGTALTLTLTYTLADEPGYSVMLYVYLDGEEWDNHGITFKLQDSSDSSIEFDATSETADTCDVEFEDVPNGTYKILDGDGTNDTGETITVSDDDEAENLSYLTVEFAVEDDSSGTSSGSTISATYNSAPIDSGDIVLVGKILELTAAGEGATNYTYAWDDIFQGETSATVSAELDDYEPDPVNTTCTVTGAADTAIDYADLGAITDISAQPVKNASTSTVTTPAIANGASYTASGEWSGGVSGGNFDSSGTATYTITLTPSSGYTFVGTNIADTSFASDFTEATPGVAVTADGANLVISLAYTTAEPPTLTPVTFTAAEADGASGTSTTTGITITFSEAVTGLTADDITITNGSMGQATKDTLTGSGDTYTIGITVQAEGDVTVAIADFGDFDVTAPPATVMVYKELVTHTLTYDGNTNDSGSAPVDHSSPYASGTSVNVLDNTGSLGKTGMEFGGWNTEQDGSGTTYVPFDPTSGSFTITENTTLYALWYPAIAELTVGFSDADVTVTGGSATNYILVESLVGLDDIEPGTKVTDAAITGLGTLLSSGTGLNVHVNNGKRVVALSVDADDYITGLGYSNQINEVAQTYAITQPEAITTPVNGITASAILSDSSASAGTEVTVTVTLAGQATTTGEMQVSLTSAADVSAITPPAITTVDVTTDGYEANNETFEFTFIMPANNVTDLVIGLECEES